LNPNPQTTLMDSPQRPARKNVAGKRWLHKVIVICVGGTALATMGATAAGAQGKQVSPERWVRQVCTGWSRYADVDTDAFASFDDVAGSLEAGELKPKKAHERLVQLQQNRVDGIDQVVHVVQRSDVPSVANGAGVRRAYLETVKEYRTVDTQLLAEYRKLRPTSGDDLQAAVQQLEQRRVDDLDTIGYDPLEELRGSPVLATAIDGATACGDVAAWIDLSGYSDFSVGQCLALTGNATLESFELRDTEEVDCAAPHAVEVFAQTQHPAAVREPYPGDEALGGFADQQCAGAFAGYVGRDFDSSSLSYWMFYPDDQGWKANDREILCVLGPSDGAPLTRPAQGSGL
jgi:hypothetical protein